MSSVNQTSIFPSKRKKNCPYSPSRDPNSVRYLFLSGSVPWSISQPTTTIKVSASQPFTFTRNSFGLFWLRLTYILPNTKGLFYYQTIDLQNGVKQREASRLPGDCLTAISELRRSSQSPVRGTTPKCHTH